MQLRHCGRYLRLLGLVALAYLFARAAKVAGIKTMTGQNPTGFYAAMLVTVRFFYECILSQVAGLLTEMKAGKGSMMALPDEAF